MKYIIGSARKDENNKYSGGKPGDQTGQEVATQDFYIHKKSWIIIRAKDDNIALKLANKMNTACSNPNIGYSQSDRASIHKVGIDTGSKCNCDCSSLVRQCVIESIGQDVPNFNTASELQVLKATGYFNIFAYKPNDKLYTGDILVTATKGHTVIVIKGETRTKPINSNQTIINTNPDNLPLIYKVLPLRFPFPVYPKIDGVIKREYLVSLISDTSILECIEIDGDYALLKDKSGWVSINGTLGKLV